MQIKVKSLQGDEYLVEVESDKSVGHLKNCISERANGLPVGRQKLVYRGRTMQDTSLLSDYNLEEGCKVHLIIQKELSSTTNEAPSSSSFNPSCPMDQQMTETPSTAAESSILLNDKNRYTETGTSSSKSQQHKTINPNAAEHSQKRSRFEVILREQLASHFAPSTVEKIMANLHHEINADINSSSLDDLERLAKQKLNISNE